MVTSQFFVCQQQRKNQLSDSLTKINTIFSTTLGNANRVHHDIYSDIVNVQNTTYLNTLDLAHSSTSACSLVGFWTGLGWLVLICCERKTLLADWFGLIETNQRIG